MRPRVAEPRGCRAWRSPCASGCAHPWSERGGRRSARCPESDRPPGALPNDNGPSPAIFPPQELTIRFNHRRHVQDLKLTCTTCHDKARTSRASADSMLPKGTRCDACHGSDHRDPMQVRARPERSDGSVRFLSSGLAAAQPATASRHGSRCRNRTYRVSIHALHVSAKHQAARSAPRRGRKPRACHARSAAENARLLQLSPSAGPMLPAALVRSAARVTSRIRTRHDQGQRLCLGTALATELAARCGPRSGLDLNATKHWSWPATTAASAPTATPKSRAPIVTTGESGRVCVHPTTGSACIPVAARENQQKCTSCHRDQSVLPDLPRQTLRHHHVRPVCQPGRARSLPLRRSPEWTDGPRTPRHHAWEAERNISACVSCHVERDCAISTCHRCHGRARFRASRPAPARVTPILTRSGFALAVPPRWGGDQNARPCLVCHTPDATQICWIAGDFTQEFVQKPANQHFRKLLDVTVPRTGIANAARKATFPRR